MQSSRWWSGAHACALLQPTAYLTLNRTLRQPRAVFGYTLVRGPAQAGHYVRLGPAQAGHYVRPAYAGRYDVTDARPGGHAKWVRNPHGPATVNGERRIIGCHWATSLGRPM